MGVPLLPLPPLPPLWDCCACACCKLVRSDLPLRRAAAVWSRTKPSLLVPTPASASCCSERLQAEGAAALPAKVCIVAGKGKSKDAGQSIIKEVRCPSVRPPAALLRLPGPRRTNVALPRPLFSATFFLKDL